MNNLIAKLYQYMYGRNGIDLMNKYLLGLFGVLYLLTRVIRFWPVVLICYGLFIYICFRTLSKNITKRQIENKTFLDKTLVLRRLLKVLKNNLTDREHTYMLCSNCYQMVRIPKHKGQVIITCPKCKHRFEAKS